MLKEKSAIKSFGVVWWIGKGSSSVFVLFVCADIVMLSSIWAFGPKRIGPNILVNGMKDYARPG